MARGRRINTLDDEYLSKEEPKVQEAVMSELLENNNDKKQELVKEPQKEKCENKDTKVTEKCEKLQAGDYVKIKDSTKYDTLGRRIHAGLKGYTYKILNIRVDDLLTCECLTHVFILNKDDVYKVK